MIGVVEYYNLTTVMPDLCTRRLLKNPNIVAVRFIGPFIKASFINETSTKNHFISRLLGLVFELSR